MRAKRTGEDAIWRPTDGLGFEHLRVFTQGESRIVDSVVVRELNGKIFRATYKISCSKGWRFHRLELELQARVLQCLTLESGADGRWLDGAGDEVENLRGCAAIDISATPFTNTLAIEHLALETGQNAPIRVAYIGLPELTVEPVEQRYTCREKNRLYLYENASDFEALLQVDENMLVLDYPGLFERVR